MPVPARTLGLRRAAARRGTLLAVLALGPWMGGCSTSPVGPRASAVGTWTLNAVWDPSYSVWVNVADRPRLISRPAAGGGGGTVLIVTGGTLDLTRQTDSSTVNNRTRQTYALSLYAQQLGTSGTRPVLTDLGIWTSALGDLGLSSNTDGTALSTAFQTARYNDSGVLVLYDATCAATTTAGAGSCVYAYRFQRTTG